MAGNGGSLLHGDCRRTRGTALGLASTRYIETLLYQVETTDWGVLALPSLAIVAAASLAALPSVIRAVRINPATILRAE